MLLENTLKQLSLQTQPIFLGYSGGVDSQFLFNQLIEHKIKFTALHIHHGLQTQADQWLEHCQNQCKANNIDFYHLKTTVKNTGKGLEDAARNTRINFFRQHMDQTDQVCTLLLAHHQDDQIETFFLRLMRGASLQGLSSIKSTDEFYGHKVVRPLLEINKQSIIDQAYQLNWVEDPTNQESDYDRNFLRNEILPLLATRWPQYNQNIQQSIEHIQNSNNTIEQIYNNKLDQKTTQNQLAINSQDDELIYYWLKNTLEIQPTKKLISSLLSLISAKQLNQAFVNYLDQRFIYDGEYLILESSQTQKQDNVLEIKFNQPFKWQNKTIELCETDKLSKTGLIKLDETKLSIQNRPNNQKLSIYGRDKRRDLKRLIQEIDLSWKDKQSLAFVFYEQKLIAIDQYFIVNEFAAKKGDCGIEIICK